MKITSTNPSNNYQVIGEVEFSTLQEVKDKVAAARSASKMWRELGLAKRSELVRELADLFDKERARIIEITAKEMGMPLKELDEDVDFSLEYLRSYCDMAEKSLKSFVTTEDEKEIHEVFREPYGVAACIVPWNFPLANFVWQCGQNLVAGNTVVFKHSEETQLCGQLIEELVNQILPEGVFNEVYGDGTVGETLVNEDVDLICFTGSSKTGAKINESAAKRFIPTVMELGGSAPGIVFESSEVKDVVETIYTARFMNCGQMCDGLKRLIVHESKIDEVVDQLTKLITSKKIGRADDPDTDISSLVAERQVVLLEEQVQDALDKGATAVIGGRRLRGGGGAFYEPTLLTNVTSEMRVWDEEVFGPVLPVVSFSSEEEAVNLANDTKYGLGAYIFTSDNEQFLRVAHQIESGMVSQNNLSYINVCNPFGGYKMSGNGREHGELGFEEVTRSKIITREK